MGDQSYPECRAQELFDEFVSASTCRVALRSFSQLCEHLQLDKSATERPLYRAIKERLNYWRANALWAKLERRAAQQEYDRGRVCSNTTCVIIGAGPCGLRTAVELSFMGARVVLVEKRDSFSRNNVLHLWPFTIHDLRGIGAKKLYGKFCAGSIDHISIRQLQLILLKVALLVGVEVHVNVEFKHLEEPPQDQSRRVGWRMQVCPESHPVNQLEFDVIIGADGRRNTLPGFRRKEFRGKLAIAITANFKNRNSTAEAKVEELSGVAFIFNQRFFQELRQETGIDLENIVYYKDDTHYFVMTAKKQSLLEKGVILQDFADTQQLLSQGNVDHDALQVYAREAADFSTNHQLPSLDFAMNHYGQPDVAMFDFTCMYASENAAMVRQRHGHQLLVTLVGDSLLEPFWPMGTGVARGFLAALDSSWMIRSWSRGGAPLDVLAERESLYRLLHQTTPENMQKNFSLFSVDPTTRYVNVHRLMISPAQVRHLVDTGEEVGLKAHCGDIIRLPSPGLFREESSSRTNQLLTWCQEQTRGYRGVAVTDLTTSWKSGLALCALIHRYRPDLIDFKSLAESSAEEITCLTFDIAEREFGIPPLMTVDEMSRVGEPDSLSMVMYLSQFYQLLKDAPPPAGGRSHSADFRSGDLRSAVITPAFVLSRLGHSPSRRKNPKELRDSAVKKRRTSGAAQEQRESHDWNGGVENQVCDEVLVGGSKVRLLANQLQARLDKSSSSSASTGSRHRGAESPAVSPSESADAADAAQPLLWKPRKRTLLQEQMSFRFREKIRCQSGALSRDEQQCPVEGSDTCVFCKDRVYVMERLSAEGLFFHRSCFQCDVCSDTLRPTGYAFDQQHGTFYCLHCYERRLSTTSVRRRRTTASDRATSHRTSTVSLGSAPHSVSTDSVMSVERRRSSVVSVMAATPERIELENCRRSSTRLEAELLEELEEVSEEMLNQFNLSLDQKHESRSRSRSSSESEIEDEKEGERGRGGRHHVTSEEAKASWRETLKLHLNKRDNQEEEEEEEEEEKEEEEDDEEEEGGSELETSDEGEYSPWQMERHSGLWLLSEAESEDGLLPLVSRSVSLVAGSDITGSDTLAAPDFVSSVRPGITSSTPSSLTPPPSTTTPSTASYTTPDSAHHEGSDTAPSTHTTSAVIMETVAQRHTPQQPAADSISSELHLKRPLHPHDKGAGPDEVESDGVRRHPFPPLQGGGRALLLHLKGLKEAPPTGQGKVQGGGAKALWRSVFSINKEKKKRGGSLKKNSANQRRAIALTEESDLDSSTLLQRCSLTPRKNLRLELFDLTSEIQNVTIQEEEEETKPAYVPHALAFKRSYAIKGRPVKDRVPIQDSDGQSSCSTELVGVIVQPKEPSSLSVKEVMFQRGQEDENEDLDAKITRRVQRVARQQAKQEQLRRLHKAQIIQRRLQQVEEKQKQLEEKGVMMEKALRGETDYWADDSPQVDLHLRGLGKVDDPGLMQQWFELVQQKNSLVQYECELMIFARELELEDRQSRLQQELRERMAVDDHLKEDWQLLEERLILEEMLDVVEQRDSLVSLLEEHRLQEGQGNLNLEEVTMT
uniref:protein-methionine sulfoxide oxidase mical3b isoform X1 n=1 Tax=Solea senegalensis TaxID=28829 RepID=UPI001CD861A1|nr:protein-methionine sulfoxide oxidase mical3b isoform X1 [Solea senegalensis]